MAISQSRIGLSEVNMAFVNLISVGVMWEKFLDGFLESFSLTKVGQESDNACPPESG